MSMKDRLHTDVASELFALEEITVANFSGIKAYAAQLQSIIDFGERFYEALGNVVNGKSKTISITPAEIKEMGNTCRTVAAALGELESSRGVKPMHVIRLIRELQTVILLVANTADIFAEDRTTDLKDTWGG